MFSKNLTRVSLFFFKDIILKFKSYLSNFDKVLDYTEVNEDSISYVSNILFISVFSLIVLEFLFIFLMIKLNILFNLLSFFITIFISITFSFMIFLLLFKYPYYLLDSKKQKINIEFNKNIRHLSVLKDENLTIKDVLNVFRNLEGNYFLSKEAQIIINMTEHNHNLRDVFKSIISETYSEVEKNFFRKLIEVIDNKENLNQVIVDFLATLEQSRKEYSEQKKSRVNLLFSISIFLFFFFITIMIILFMTIVNYNFLKNTLLIFAIAFTIIEFILIVILYR